MNKKQTSTPSTALAAVAFQDHLLKDLAIGELSLSGAYRSKKPSLSESLRLQEKRRKLALKKKKPVVDSGRKQNKVSNEASDNNKEDLEFVLDPRPRPLTLAQKLGLIPHSKDQEKLLTESEWSAIKEASHHREDFKSPCVICKDDFRMEDQVLLSCTHVFHRACLQAFERFTGRKTCPMCRHESYQTRVVHDGTRIFKQKCATKIQALWRGFVVRKWYHELRRTVPPNDQKLRKKFYQSKLSEITDRMVAMTSTERIDRFLENIDESVAECRNVFRYFENSVLAHLTDEDWTDIEVRASERGATECPICLRELGGKSPRCDQGESSKPKEAVALLSCSHVFHATCLNTLETFSLDYESPTSDFLPATTENVHRPSFKCPVCRTLYLKRIVNL